MIYALPYRPIFFVLAKKLVINGTINGDLTGAAKTAYLNQKNVMTIRLLGSDTYFKGKVSNDFLAAGESLTFYENSQIDNNFAAAFNNIVVSGTINGNANIKAGFLKMEPGTYIGGDLQYGAPSSEIAPTLFVQGKIVVLEKEFLQKQM